MKKTSNELREQALDYISSHGIDASRWENDPHRLIEELSIHQIELEAQNEELILAQIETKQLTDRLNDLFENAPVGYLILNKNEEIKRVNHLFCTMTGFDNDELIGINLSKLIAPAFQNNFYHFFSLLRNTEKAAFMEAKLRCKYKKDLYIRLDGIIQKAVENYRIAVTDISLNKRLEVKLKNETEKLYQSETKFRQFVEHSSDVFFYQNIITRKFEYVSPKITELLGYSPEECINMTKIDQINLFLPEYHKRYAALFESLVEAEKEGELIINRKFELYTKNGEVKWVNGFFSLIKSTNGNICQLMGCLHDITNDKTYEKELICARQKAEESDALKSAFLANMSHEIRTPLNSIIGFSSLLKDEIMPDSECFEFATLIENSGQRLLNLINDIISISKIESHQLEINIRIVDFKSILDEAYKVFNMEVTNKGLVLYYADCPPIQLRTDKEKITSVIYNLIKNAIKYTERGMIEYGASIINDNQLYFYVKDTGIGIPEDKLEKIFNRFTQVQSTRFEEGVGLGLSICKGMMQLLNGEIGVKSEDGKGSLFYFTLPLEGNL